MHEERYYLIFSMTEIDKVDFTQVLETSAETLRLTVDGTKSFVKWNGEQPAFVSTMTTAEGPYTYSEILNLLNSVEWTKPPEVM